MLSESCFWPGAASSSGAGPASETAGHLEDTLNSPLDRGSETAPQSPAESEARGFLTEPLVRARHSHCLPTFRHLLCDAGILSPRVKVE